MKRFRISYYYLATGMEGVPDTLPEKIVEAETKEMAAYIYLLMNGNINSKRDVEKVNSDPFGTKNFAFTSFSDFVMKEDWEKYWGLKIEDL